MNQTVRFPTYSPIAVL